MAFRASNVIPADQYINAKRLALSLKNYCQDRASAFASGTNSHEILRVAETLLQLKGQLQSAASTPGMAAYATGQEDDVGYNVVAEFNAMVSAIDAALAEIVTALPKDGNDYLLITKINPDGSLDYRTFSPGALNTLRSLLNSISSSVS